MSGTPVNPGKHPHSRDKHSGTGSAYVAKQQGQGQTQCHRHLDVLSHSQALTVFMRAS